VFSSIYDLRFTIYQRADFRFLMSKFFYLPFTIHDLRLLIGFWILPKTERSLRAPREFANQSWIHHADLDFADLKPGPLFEHAPLSGLSQIIELSL
jgi:hypothetical protein